MEWIKTSDKLPKENGQYLVIIKGNRRVAKFNIEDKKFKYGSLKTLHVSHWSELLPLPLNEKCNNCNYTPIKK